MRTITIQEEIYKYNELSDDAKYNAQMALQYDVCDDNMNSLEKFAELFNLKIKNYEIDLSGGNCCHSFIHWESEQNNEIDEMRHVRLYTYLYNNYRSSINMECSMTGYFMDNSLMFHLVEFLKRPYDINFYDLIQLCIDEFLKDYLNDINEYYTDENMNEMCGANDYEFTIDGKLF